MNSISLINKQDKTMIAIAVGITAFLVIFMGTQMILTEVYGQVDLLNASGKASLGLGLSIPISNDVDAYVEHIKAEICPTLNSTAAEEEECNKI